MPLNINLQQIALHALNFVILFGAISHLVSAATEKLVLKSSASEAYEQFLDAAERGGDDE